jgi:GDPmannose 4,6-dehydratase
MKKVIITGVTGQDGSLMVDYLLANTDYEIYGGVRRLSVSNHKNIKHLKNEKRFKIFDFDLSDPHSIRNCVMEIKPDYFINFAAQSFVGVSWEIPRTTFTVNALAVLDVLEAIRTFAPECRFYNAGSSEEFGDVQYSPQDEDHPLRPRSPYGAAKASARHIVKVYRESYNLFAIQGWLFNHEGHRRGEEFVTRKITQGVARIYNEIHSVDRWRSRGHAESNSIKFDPIILGNLDTFRDWSNAEDFMHGIWLMLNNDEPKEYVLASGKTHSIREFVEKTFKQARIDHAWDNKTGAPDDDGYDPLEEKLLYLHYNARTSRGEYIPLVTISPLFYRPNEVDSLQGDPSRAIKELKYDREPSLDMLVYIMLSNDMKVHFPEGGKLLNQNKVDSQKKSDTI